MSAVSGRCACGAVHYVVEGVPKLSLHCQCRKCQRATGGGHASIFVVEQRQLALTGDLTYFAQAADSGQATRNGFCPICGSPILGLAERFPTSRYIHAATLDDPNRFAPTLVVHCESAQPWDNIVLPEDLT